MDFDLSWILLGLPIAFVLGWLASRLDFRQLRLDNRLAPKAYFKGLNYLLNEQQDKAIDAFIEAVQKDPDTSELHFALGNLFRRRGETERAVRVHEHLLSRGDLSAADRDRSQHALAMDFLKAGLLDRAEDALRKLEGTAYEARSRLALLSIYERSRDWADASEIAHKLETSDQGSFSGRQSHYLCEQAAAQPPEAAQALLEKAIAVAPQAARPRIDLAILQQQAGANDEAFKTLLALSESAPAAIPLVADRIATVATAAGLTDSALELLEASYAHTASLDVLEAILGLQIRSGTPITDVRMRYIQHLEREQSLVAAARWIAGEKLEHEEFHPQIQRALDHAANPLKRYRCAACGFEAKQHFWQCPGCQAWDSYPARRVEEL
ncbi:lipopolysaccharide biosynthesis regulator YciM [Rhodoferax ferrireducens]|uniref:Lipopolysaccharide assembly protein B n=1 Tax=Rhodoferax ferrireducens TaxID=192843 RepID=A0ABU2C436_9BURK|nr:lipopolysaccharide assembly protein LapB [Rhodoferax ferrireducens]MDR7376101.1 lipopolysaccharide biosynthesis regulator YciM [Rhodoferax ferrireducens]